MVYRFFRQNWIPLALATGGLITRFLFIWHPAEVVFDEVHFGKFVNGYLKGEYYFDIHPPLGKLLVTLSAFVAGYRGDFSFSSIGDPYVGTFYIWLRFLPALAGALIPWAVYLFSRALGMKPLAAGLAGAFLVFDNALLVQSHIILVDAFLILFGFLGLACFFASRQKNYDLLRFFGASLFLALSLSVKWTGIGFFIPVAVVAALDIVSSISSARRNIRGAFSLAGKLSLSLITIPIIVYFGIFVLHFSLLPKSGPGDAFMSQEFLRGEKSILGKFMELNERMYSANATLSATHPYSSKFYTWPFMVRPVYYWVKDFSEGSTGRIYLLGNPVLWWTVLAGFILALFFWKPKPAAIKWWLYFAYAINLLLFAPISRVVFLYHYLPALIFSVAIFSGWLLDSLDSGVENKRRAIFITGLILLFVIVGFLFFSPLSYGLGLTENGYRLRTWLGSWI